MAYKMQTDQLINVQQHLNFLLKLGVVPGYCMDIINNHDSEDFKMEIYDAGDYNFQVKVVPKKKNLQIKK